MISPPPRPLDTPVAARSVAAPALGPASSQRARDTSVEERTHLLTLRFLDPAIERAYDEELAQLGRGNFRVIVPFGLVLYAAAGIPDLMHAVSSTVVLIRYAIVTPVLVAASSIGWASPDRFRRWHQLVIAAGMTLMMLSNVAMVFTGEPSPATPFRVIGLVLVLLGSHTLIMLRHSYAVAASLVASLAFTIASFASTRYTGYQISLITLYLFIANGLGAFGSRSLERYRRRDFLQRRLLDRERAVSESLLLNVLPHAIAQRLKCDERAIADRFPEVTVLFADIVGFTPLAQSLEPEALVRILDDVFSAFDDLAERFGLEKIKTIGDAYMVVGGLPSPRADHAEAVAAMAIEMLRLVAERSFGDGHRLALRIGMHSGPAVAGVIGKHKFSYDLWGDTVNTASRMEAHGLEGTIQVTEATYALLRDRFELEPRGVVTVRGKGEMVTYLLRSARAATVDTA